MNNKVIALIFFGDLKYCPYLNRYTERLDLLDKKYEVLFWNRSGDKLVLPDNYFYYEEKSDLTKNKFNKFFDFVKARNWFIKRLEKTKPDKVIFLSTLSAIFLADYIINSKIKYILDIRDYSYENIKIFAFLEKKLIKNSCFTAISSEGYINFLPKHNYIIAHNFNRADLLHKKKYNKNKNIPVRILFNGVIRFFNWQKQYLDALKNDNRFKLIYYGEGPELELYKNYSKLNNILNIEFKGPYENKNKHLILNEADIINNTYGNIYNITKTKYAISNRFYDGLIFHIPQLVEPDGFKTSLILKNRIGTNLSVNPNFANELYDYYMNIDENKFDNDCNNALEKILLEDIRYIEQIDNFINN